VSIFGAKLYNHGNYSVLLDGVRKMTGSGTGDLEFSQSLFNVSDLSSGKHDVVIANDESGTYLDVDYIVVTSGNGDTS
jgi:hypothetical protein